MYNDYSKQIAIRKTNKIFIKNISDKNPMPNNNLQIINSQ